MAAIITWEQIDAKCGDDDNIAVTIREFTDGVPTVIRTLEDGTKIYRDCTSDRFHKDVPVDKFKASLKEKILSDRAKTAETNTFTGKIDFTGFEEYINQ